MEIKRIDQANRAFVDEFILRKWYTMEMVVHGERIDLGSADGWFASDGIASEKIASEKIAGEDGEIVGLITYRISGDEMEILSLDSLKENRGIGSRLLGEAVEEARRVGCTRVMLITTNDNLHALRFYQKRGFDMVRIYRNAVDESRKIKPEIPLIGDNGIPIKHEIEMEMKIE
ncbi:MAG: GNAT family N-acetyltransferase [Firmicutes bacterium]|nr:GNAT family N-acetyltransferase [Bacillota bacterium]